MLKKIIVAFIGSFIIIGIAGFVGYKLLNKKVAGAQDINSKIVGFPKLSEFDQKVSDGLITSSPNNQQASDNLSLYQPPSTNPYKSSYIPSYLGSTLSIPLSQTSTYNPTHSEDYWNALIKQAEEEAAKSHEELQNFEDCLAFKRAKDAAFLPLKQAINDLRTQYNNMDEIVTERTKGTDVNEAQRQGIVAAEKQKIQSQIDQFQSEYNRLYTEYGSC